MNIVDVFFFSNRSLKLILQFEMHYKFKNYFICFTKITFSSSWSHKLERVIYIRDNLGWAVIALIWINIIRIWENEKESESIKTFLKINE